MELAPSESPSGPEQAAPGGQAAGSPAEAPITEAPDLAAGEPGQQTGEPRIKLGEREYSVAEAQTYHADLLRRLQGADKTTAKYRERAQQAIDVANQLRDLALKAGLISEDGQFVTRSPEEIRKLASQPQKPEQEQFQPPDFFKIGDDQQTRQFYIGLKELAAEKGIEYAFATFADHLNSRMKEFWEGMSGKYLPGLLDENLAPMRPFFQSLEQTKTRADFLYAMQQERDDSDAYLYPELQDGEKISGLNRIMDRLSAGGMDVHTYEAFQLAVDLLRAQSHNQPPQQPRSAPPQPARRSAPPVVTEPAPSGLPRPKANGTPDAARRLLSKQGQFGGMDFGF